MDGIPKAYGQPRKIDALLDVIDLDPELGFNPYFWISRRLYEKWVTEPMQKKTEQEKAALLDAYNNYRKYIDLINTEEMLRGQAFGL